MAKKYHYEYFAYTDNLNYGRMLIAQCVYKSLCYLRARNANKGCFVVEKHRVYDE